MHEDEFINRTHFFDSTLNKHQERVAEICHPLFKTTPLDYFDYTAYFDTGEIIAFSTDPRLHVEVYKYDLLPHLEEFNALSSYGLKFTFLTHQLPLPPGTDSDRNQTNITKAKEFKIFNRIYYVNRYQDRYITCGFGEKTESASIFNFYLNNAALLESFIKYFERSAEELFLENTQYNKIILPNYLKKSPIVEEGNIESPASMQVDLSTHFNFASARITQRQHDCLELIAHGHTMKSAAALLGISPRTVEMHIQHIKINNNLSSKQDLLNLWYTHCGKYIYK